MNFYKDKSNPLEEITLSNMENGHTYINDEGIRFIYNETTEGEIEMVVIQKSELNMGEDIKELTPKQLKLYWTLMKNKEEGKIG